MLVKYSANIFCAQYQTRKYPCQPIDLQPWITT